MGKSTHTPFDIQVAGSSVYSIDYTGAVITAGGTSTTMTDTIAFMHAGLANTVYAGTTPWSRSLVRIAAGNWCVRQTSGNNDNTMQIAWNLGSFFRKTTAAKGIKINSFKVAHSIATQDLGAETITYKKAVYAASSANAMTDLPVTGGLTNTKDVVYLDAITVTTPVWLVTANADYIFDIAIAATTSGCVWDIYGLYVVYDEAF